MKESARQVFIVTVFGIVLGFVLFGCSSGGSSAPPSAPVTSAPGATSTPSLPGATSSALPSLVTVKITGTPPTARDVIIKDGSKTTQVNTPLPYSTTITDSPVSVSAGASTIDSGSVTCKITARGQKTVTNTSTGPGAEVYCLMQWTPVARRA